MRGKKELLCKNRVVTINWDSNIFGLRNLNIENNSDYEEI